MYIINIFKRLISKSGIPLTIYLLLNVFVISGVVYLLFSFEQKIPFWMALLISLVLYLVSLLIALSPLGEFILRLQLKCKKIKREDMINYLEPIFTEVEEQAKRLEPSIPDGVRLFISKSQDQNAFATGRRTICITEGMLAVPPEELKAALAHEFGHIAHKDTDLILLVSVGNLIVNTIIFSIRLIIDIIHVFLYVISVIIGLFKFSGGMVSLFVTKLHHVAIRLFVFGITWLWTKIGTLLVMYTSRSNEYEADEFAFNIGYGYELCSLLDHIVENNEKGLFANLMSGHPDKDDRISKLQQLGVEYDGGFGGVNNMF